MAYKDVEKPQEEVKKEYKNGKYITLEDIQNDKDLEADILGKIQYYYVESESYMSEKRGLFEYWYKKFTSPSESDSDKIKIHILFQHLKAFISTYYSEGLAVVFNGREFLDDDFAYMLEVCAKYDYEKMNKRQKDFFHIMNIWFYGVSILMKTGYDNINNVVEYDVVSPHYRLPDPKGSTLKGFRYHMFDFTITPEEINAINKESPTWDIYVNVDKYNKMSIERTDKEQLLKDNRALSSSMVPDVYKWTRVFIEYKWCKYVADLFNQRGIIGRREKITPVTDKEKKNPHLVPFPVTVVNAFALEDDPCGIGLAELIISFQNAKNRLMNLSLRKEEWNAWFRVLLADISKITDIDLLAEKPTDWPIIIPFEGNMWPLDGNVVQPVMDWIQADQSTINLANILDQEAQLNTWYTTSQRGISSNPWETLGQSKMNQINSNLIFSLDAEVISRWETEFRKNMWLRSLKEFLPEAEAKYARIWSWLASSDVSITREQIREHWDPDISVESKKTAKEANKQKLDYMLAREAIVMANPQIPAVSKLMYQRDLEKLRWFPREEIFLRYPRTSDENRAINYIKQINTYEEFNWDKKLKEQLKPKALFYPWMDLWTYYIYLQKAKDWDLKEQIMWQLRKLMEKEGIAQPAQPSQDEWMWDPNQIRNSMSSQLTSNVVQQSWAVNNFPTREDILA